ncbi:MAG TPA: hypothetical protein DCZ80_02220, partial [Legionellales bacterium]|nr:hypothetical protein [Legionellales bacterium]
MSREQTDSTASNSSVASSALVESDVLEVYKYSDSPKFKQADSENRPKPADYEFEISNAHQTNSRQAFLDLIKNYNVETHFGPSSIRDGKPCLIKAFEKLSFAEYGRILEALRPNSDEEHSLYQAIKDLNPKTFKNFTLNPTEVQQIVGIESLSDLVSEIQQKRSVTLTQLLGSKDNLEIFKKALKEEVQSPAFLKALWEHSLKPHYGVKYPNTFAIQIMSGASGSGKSFAGEQAVNRQYPVNGTANLAKPTFWMAWVDGGIARDINVTQQYVKLLSLELGVEVDLSKDSKKILEPTKGKVKQAIITSAKAAAAENKPLNIGIVEPLTYSSDIALGDVQTEIKSVQELAEFLSTNSKKIDLSYDYVSGNDFEGHAEVVKTQGENRAFPTTDQAKSNFETMNSTTPSVPGGEAAAVENPPSRLQRFKGRIPSIRFAENKKYGPGGYQFGVNGSVNGFIEYEKAFGDGQFGVTLSRHINCNDLRVYINQNEEWELFDEAKHKGLERHVFSERLVNDWKALKDSPKAALITYASQNRSDRKYSNFMTNFNPKDLKFGLSSEVDKIFQSNLKKEGRIVKDENNLGYLVPFVKILDELHKHEQKEGDLEVYAYDDPKKIQQAIKNLSQLIAEKRKENLGKSYNPFASSSTLPLMEKRSSPFFA